MMATYQPDPYIDTDAAAAFLAPQPMLYRNYQPQTQSQRPNTYVKPQKILFTSCWAFFCGWQNIIFVGIVYGITTYVTVTATQRHTLLGSVSPSIGVWILNILSKLTDVTFGFFANEIWEKVQWALLAKKGRLNLSVFFALSSTTGYFGSWEIMTHGWRRWFCSRKRKNGQAPDPDPEIDRARGWSFGRILVATCIIGPGIIITADINTKTLYFPVESHNIGGGIGYYNSSYPPIFQGYPSTLIASLVQTFLVDTTRAYPLDPISTECTAAGPSCKSYLIPGGLGTVTPWPFLRFKDQSITAFQTKNAPAYQIDFWDGPDGIVWAPSDCHIYGELGHYMNAFQVCITTYPNKPGHLVSSWRGCPTEVTASMECNQTGSWAGSQTWTTSMVVYRRLATVTSSQKDSIILDAKDLGQPTIQSEAQGMSPKDLFMALDSFIYSTRRLILEECKVNNPSWQLYVYLGGQLDILRVDNARALSLSLDLLRNLLTVPIYLYNDLIMSLGPVLPAINTVQPGLPSENYVQGSYTVTSTRSIPGSWTVWIYIVVGAIALLTGLIIQLGLLWSDAPTLSGNPIVDFVTLTKNADAPTVANQETGWLSSAFYSAGLGNHKTDPLDTLAGLNIAIKGRVRSSQKW